MAPAPEGVAARIMPIEDGLDAMAKQISATGRTHPVFELAWVVLGGLDRFHVIFESPEQPIYKSKSDHSAHLWSADLVKKYYDEEITEVDPPTGNFQSVARCGFSGKLIGPPNHHAYQQTLLDLHREQFSHMPLDRYKSKIVMEHSEEAVQEWIDSMRQQKRWRPKPEQDDKSAEKTEDKAPGGDETPGTDDAAEAPESTVETPAAPPAEPAIEETVVILDNHREVEQHFMVHGFDRTLLRNTVSEEKRYPGNLASILCRQMSGRHLAVFKWKKRLHCGPARPKRVPDDMVMADRPAKLFHWVIDNPGGNIDAMWKVCLPADIDDEARHTWYHDLHWLINEGIVLLFPDGTLHAAKELEKKPPEPAKQPTEAERETKPEKEPEKTPGASPEQPPAPEVS